MPEGVDIDGLNLLPLVTTESKQDWDRQTLFWQSGHYRVVRQGDWKLQVAERPDGGPWLHNLAVDPYEQNNLASSHPDKLAELMALLDAHQKRAREPLYPSAVEAVVTLDKTLAEEFEDGDEYIYWPN
jgi:arylsulfatase A-like enzyme